MRTLLIITSVISVVAGIIETLKIQSGDMGKVTPFAYVPYPILGIVVLIDGFFLWKTISELREGIYVGEMFKFRLILYIFIITIALMVLFIILSAIISGIKGFLVSMLSGCIFLLAALGTSVIIYSLVSVVARIAGISIMFAFLAIAAIGLML